MVAEPIHEEQPRGFYCPRCGGFLATDSARRFCMLCGRQWEHRHISRSAAQIARAVAWQLAPRLYG